MKKWVYKNCDKAFAKELAEECQIDPFTALLLTTKGITDPFLIDEFLSDEIFCQDPYLFADMAVGVERINRAIENKEKIAVFGDYDCDGITSTVLLYSVLKELGADVIYRVPCRDDGYGMSVDAVDELNENGVKLIITVDNGITAFDAIDRAEELKIDVVVTDHHLPSDKLPNALAVIDPKREDCPTEFKDYAGVGVAFMLCSAISDTPVEELVYAYGDLVAIGTIADIMPILSDNRTLVKHGIKCLRSNTRVGLSALVKAAGLDIKKMTSTNIAFGISPRINASGRVLNPNKAIELLLCENEIKAEQLAQELCAANVTRQQIEKDILAEALKQIEENKLLQNAPILIVGGENWHAGVIGIVAARLSNLFSKPAIVFTLEDEFAHGSARSYGDVSIYKILAENTEFLESFGGHSVAAGVTVKRENFEKARKSITLSAKTLYPVMPFPTLDISLKLNPAVLSIDNVYCQRKLEPFGEKNQLPIYAFCNMVIKDIFELSGGKHLKLLVSRQNDDRNIEVMMFFKTIKEFCFKKGDIIDIAATIDSNVYKDIESLSIIAKDVKLTSQSDKVFESVREYQNFKYFGEQKTSLKLNRDDVVAVYKKIRTFKNIDADEMMLLYIFEIDDYFKLRIILDILKELEFINFNFNGKFNIKINENAEHKDLSNSKLFNLFS